MGTRYVHEFPEWPRFTWNSEAFAAELSAIHFRRGALMTAMATLGFRVRQEAVLKVLVQDVTKSSEIEGERLDTEQVRSSICRRLGMEYAGLPAPARDVDGVVEMMLDATQNYLKPLTDERIFSWHASLFPTGRSGMTKILVGTWRNDQEGPMQVVSGPIGRERVHYEAPEAERIPAEMAQFLSWFETAVLDPVVKAAVSHLWFVSIHPMDDGNGRIGRAIMDMALARADGDSQRFYSMTAQIHRDKDEYYDILERTQRRSIDITEWIVWFLARLSAAIESAEGVLHIVRRKQGFWDARRNDKLNERQIKILNLLFEGFHGKLQTSKYAKIAKCSNPTALRDLTDLVDRGILRVDPGASGRSTSYVLTV
jgi:Fic family protein